MNITAILVDSNVLVYCLRSSTKGNFLSFLQQFLTQDKRLAISHINLFEILAGCKSNELPATELFLSRFPLFLFGSKAISRAALWYRVYRKKGKTLSIGDLFIAGIVRENRMGLLTMNQRDFPMLKKRRLYHIAGINVCMLS